VWVAQALLEALGSDSPLGTLDVSFYRDDFSQNGLHPQVRPSALPFEIEGQHLVLIDDVLMSGRTIRAAMNELFDYGRPASVTLVCLLDLNAMKRGSLMARCCRWAVRRVAIWLISSAGFGKLMVAPSRPWRRQGPGSNVKRRGKPRQSGFK
jgi:hypoxanthine-guanine phosphoribosyltransferase